LKVLVTGASGNIGSILALKLLAQGHTVYGLVRRFSKGEYIIPDNFWPFMGDVTKDNLGFEEDEWQFDAIYHVAGVINLGKNEDDLLYKTNVIGTENVVKYCLKYKVKHLFYVSTAYAGLGHNYYEETKVKAEELVKGSAIPMVTIFKPSIVLSPNDGHFSRFIESLILIHRRAELIRRKVEGTLHLPVIEPVFRIKGDAESHLNLVKVEDVAEAMATIKNEGTWWLTNPSPLTLKELGEMVGKTIMVNLRFEQSFKPMPLESTFERIARPFMPYLSDDLPEHASYLPDWHIDQEFVDQYIKRIIIGV
jgi:nucleoside-diphosphate-sugar epimerase